MVVAYREHETQFCIIPFRNGILYLHNGLTKQDKSRNSFTEPVHGRCSLAWLSRGNPSEPWGVHFSQALIISCPAGIASWPLVWEHSGAPAVQRVQAAAGSRARLRPLQGLSYRFWKAARTGATPLGCPDPRICFTFCSFIPFPPLSPSQVLFSTISKYAACQGFQLPYWFHFAHFIPLFDNYNLVVLSFFPWATTENWYSPSPLFNSAIFCLCMLQPGYRGTTGHGHLHIQDFPLLISVLKPFVISPS